MSNRAAAGVYEDRSGPVLARLLAEAGCTVDGPLVVPDGEPVEAALRDAVAAGYQVVVTTGGTGLTPGDLTPEMTRRVLDREIPGIAEAIRAAGLAAGVPAAMLSRGVAGLAGGYSSSTWQARPAGSGTAWRCWPRCCGTRSTRRTAATTPAPARQVSAHAGPAARTGPPPGCRTACQPPHARRPGQASAAGPY